MTWKCIASRVRREFPRRLCRWHFREWINVTLKCSQGSSAGTIFLNKSRAQRDRQPGHTQGQKCFFFFSVKPNLIELRVQHLSLNIQRLVSRPKKNGNNNSNCRTPFEFVVRGKRRRALAIACLTSLLEIPSTARRKLVSVVAFKIRKTFNIRSLSDNKHFYRVLSTTQKFRASRPFSFLFFSLRISASINETFSYQKLTWANVATTRPNVRAICVIVGL